MKLSTLVCVIVLVCAACTGPMGPAGETGAMGAVGLDGIDGEDGTDGAPGAAGPRGIQGPAGMDGADGVDGHNGEDGLPGAEVPAVLPTYRPTYWMSCDKSLDLIGDDGITETYLSYSLTQFNNLDIAVDCTAAIGSAQNGNDSRYYPGVTTGANIGGCAASADLPPQAEPINVVGLWIFSVIDGPHAVYADSDSDHPFAGFAYSFIATDCAAFELSNELTWARVTPFGIED